MKLSFRRNTNNKIYGIEILLSNFHCNQHDCPYSSACRKHSVISTFTKRLNKIIKKIHLWLRYENVENLSGTTSCPYSIPRRYNCEDCKHLCYDTSLNGYCKVRNNVQVLDDNGHVCYFATGNCCMLQEVSDLSKNWDKNAGKIVI